MTEVISTEELAKRIGKPLDEVEAMIAEAEADAITKESMDPSTFVFHNWSPAADERCREILRQVKAGKRSGTAES